MGEVSGEVHREIGRNRLRRPLGWIAAGLALMLAGGVAIQARRDTMADPIERTISIPLPGLSRQAAPLRILLLSDIHVGDPDMPADRAAHIVERLNRLHPDMVLIAGDFISDKWLLPRHYSFAKAIAPLAGLHAPLGTVAVLGNHDYQEGAPAAQAALQRLGIRVLRNEAMRLGPLTIGGLGDHYNNDTDSPATLAAMRRLGPPYVLLAHEPDSFIHLPREFPLMMAGHTHCGQISLPLIGPIITGSHYGRRYVCGLVREHGARLIVTAGLGTSDLPIRLGAHGDVWLITLTPG